MRSVLALLALLLFGGVAEAQNQQPAIYVSGGGSGSGSGSVTSISAGLGVNVTAGTCATGSITTSGTLSSCLPVNPQTTNYTLQNTDGSSVVTMSGAGLTLTIEQPTSSGNFAANWSTTILNIGTAYTTVALDSGVTATLKGCPPLGGFGIPPGAALLLGSDGTNYACQLVPGPPSWRTVSGTTDALTPGDCGNGVIYTNAGAVTVTLPNNFPPMCSVAAIQRGAGKVSPSAAAGASILANPHSFTGTFGVNSVIGLTVITNGGSTAAWLLTGDGA